MEDEEIVLPVEHFEHVGQSLPELTTELLTAHTTQSSEMQGKEKLLQKLEAEMECLQKQLQVLNRDVCSTVRTICLKEGLLAEFCQDCEQLELELAAVVQEKVTMEVQLKKVSEERVDEEKLRTRYEGKMETHRMKTQKLEQLSCTQIELESLRGKMHSLKEKRETYHDEGLEGVLNGEKQHCLQDQIAAVQASKEVLHQHNSLFEEHVEVNKKDIDFLQKDMETGRKKQAAQLRRLQRLVSEARARRRQWAKEAEQLQATINGLKERIEE